MPRFTALLTLLSLVVLLVGSSTSSASAKGNSENAHRCQKGGWAELAPSETPTVPFASQDACVAYGAQGGTIVARVDPITAHVVVTMGPLAGGLCPVTLTVVDGSPGMLRVLVIVGVNNGDQIRVYLHDGTLQFTAFLDPGEFLTWATADSLPIDIPPTVCA